MSTQQSTMDYLLDQLRQAGPVTCRKMFGEYALYCNDKVVAFICDDQLYLKPTPAARALIGTPEEAPPYPGAKLYFLITEDRWEDRQWLEQLIRTTADALPAPKPT